MEKTFRINPKSVFSVRDLPSCVYRSAFVLTENPYMSAQVFFKDLSFHESLQLYQMVQMITAEHSGAFKPSNATEDYMLTLSRVTMMKCTELLYYGAGETDLSAEVFMEKFVVFGAMVTVHFMNITGSLTANYEKFDINSKDCNAFLKEPPPESAQET